MKNWQREWIFCSAIIFLGTLNGQDMGIYPDIGSLDSLLNIKIDAAAKYSQSIREAPASVTVITAADIADYHYQTVGDALGSVRGFYLSYDRAYLYLGVRGFSRPSDYNNRILILLNGHTMNENIFDFALIGTALGMHLNNVERIEIVQGPGSVLYGSRAIAKPAT